MKMKLFFGLVVSTMILATSCGSLPQTNIDATNVAVEAARTAQADIYMPTEFKAIEDSLTSVMQTIETENTNLCKNFDSATTKLDELKVSAEALAVAASEKKNAVKSEVEANLAAAKATIEEVNAAIAKAPRKANKELVAQVKGGIESLSATVNEIETAISGEVNYIEILEKISAIQSSISAIQVEINTNILKK